MLEPAHGWITVLLLVGIVGVALQVVTKLDVLDGYDLSSIFALRTERAMQLASAERPGSAGWAAVGFLTYPAGVVGLCGVFRWYEQMYVGRVALAATFGAGAPIATLVGKSWDFQVTVALGVPLDESLAMIADSVVHATTKVREGVPVAAAA